MAAGRGGVARGLIGWLGESSDADQAPEGAKGLGVRVAKDGQGSCTARVLLVGTVPAAASATAAALLGGSVSSREGTRARAGRDVRRAHTTASWPRAGRGEARGCRGAGRRLTRGGGSMPRTRHLRDGERATSAMGGGRSEVAGAGVRDTGPSTCSGRGFVFRADSRRNSIPGDTTERWRKMIEE